MEPKKTVMELDTVALEDEESAIVIIDQTKLPGELRLLHLKTQKEIWDAIYLLQVRGAPAIGVTAGFGIYLAAKEIAAQTEDFDTFYREFQLAKDYLDSSRPTAVNLSWALRRMEQKLLAHRNDKMDQILDALKQECMAIRDEDIRVCKAIGEYGLSLVKPGWGLLTHCNAGKLCAVQYGTATAPMYLGQERGYGFHVYCDETRPLLQGARLTAFELRESGLDVTLQCDNMSASLMRSGKIQAVFVGCDRVAANGDTANKIGTSMVALAAKRYHVPMYICAPTATIDMACKTGDGIPVEQRKPEEVTEMWYSRRMAPEQVGVYNPAFDVTDHDLITAIITEYGIAKAPFQESLQEIFEKKKENRI